MKSVGHFKLIRGSKPSALETKYTNLYGKEFVSDLKNAYVWMRKDMRKQRPNEIVRERRRNSFHVYGDRVSVFYVDFDNENLYSQTIDENKEKTIFNYGKSKRLETDRKNNIRFLLSGLYLYDKEKTKKWRDELLGKGEKFWYIEA